VSYAFWQGALGGRDAAVGDTLIVGDRPFTLVGVTPPGFSGLEVGRGFDVALPLCAQELWDSTLDRRDAFWLVVMGRLRDGVSAARAAERLRAESATVFEATLPTGYDASFGEIWRKLRLTVEPAPNGVSRLRKSYEAALWLLVGITGLVLA